MATASWSSTDGISATPTEATMRSNSYRVLFQLLQLAVATSLLHHMRLICSQSEESGCEVFY